MAGKEGDLRQRYSGFLDREPLALDKARLILEAVVNTPEDSFRKYSDLDRIGNYGIGEVRQALTVVASDLFKTHPGKDNLDSDIFNPRLSQINKETPYGTLYIEMIRDKHASIRKFLSFLIRKRVIGRPEFLQMSLIDDSEPSRYVLESGVLLKNRQAPWVSVPFNASEGFFDSRGKLPDVTFMHDALEDAKKGSMDKFRKTHLGMRWMAANMLEWDLDLKLPEDLDKIPAPQNG